MKKNLAILFILVWLVTFLVPVTAWAELPEAGVDEITSLGKLIPILNWINP